MSLEKRKKVYDLAKKYNIIILEDNPYGELRFAGEEILTIKSFDKDGYVVYSGSYSEVMRPECASALSAVRRRLSRKWSLQSR